MKKLLLSLCLTTFWTFGAKAVICVGDYIYTDDAKYRISGDNVIENGDFSNGLSGWTTDGGGALSTDTFGLANDAPDGALCMKVLHRGDAFSGGAIRMNWQLNVGQTYIFTYKLKSTVTDATSIASDKNNYQDLFLNPSGSNDKGESSVQAAQSQAYDETWTTVTYCLTPTDEATNLVLYMLRLNINDEFCDFGLYQVTQVGDDRALTAKVEEMREVLSNPYWAEATEDSKAYMEETIASVNEIMNDGSLDDLSAAQDALSMLDDVITEFYDANSANVTSYFTNGDLLSVKNKGTDVPGWEVTGDRWYCVNKGGDVYAQRSYPAGYVLDEGYCRQFQDLPKGKYMFTLDVMAQRLKKGIDPITGESSKYIVDETKTFDGIKIFINGDSTLCEPIDNEEFTTYAVYSTVAEDSALTVGIYIPCDSGQVVRFVNGKVRLIAADASDYVDGYFSAKELKSAKYALKVMIDNTEKYYTDDENYIFGKQSLRDSLDVAIEVLNTVEIADTLTNRMNRLRNARKEYVRLNAEYTQLVADIAEADSIGKIDIYSNGRETFQTALNTAVAFRQAIDPLVRDSAAIVAADNTLVECQNDYLAQNASKQTPVILRILTNPKFSNGMTGWAYDATNATISAGYKVLYDEYDDGMAAYFWRGTSIAKTPPTFYLNQETTLKYAGVYEVSAKIVAWNESNKYDTEETGVYFVLGTDAAYTDSTLVHASIPTTYALRTNYESGQTMRVGVDGMGNTCCNSFMFGEVVVTYFGSYEAYMAGISTVSQPSSYCGNVYSLSGVLVKSNTTSLAGLPKGVYIFKGKKVLVQ